MIHCDVCLNDDADTAVGGIWVRQIPRVGELLWFSGEGRAAIAERFGTGAFKVREVAHWVGTQWSPNTHVGEPVHTVCLFVEPLDD